MDAAYLDLSLGKETQVMKRFAYAIATLVVLSSLTGCASRRGFTLDGIHFIGGEKTIEVKQPVQPIDWRYVAQR